MTTAESKFWGVQCIKYTGTSGNGQCATYCYCNSRWCFFLLCQCFLAHWSNHVS